MGVKIKVTSYKDWDGCWLAVTEHPDLTLNSPLSAYGKDRQQAIENLKYLYRKARNEIYADSVETTEEEI